MCSDAWCNLVCTGSVTLVSNESGVGGVWCAAEASKKFVSGDSVKKNSEFTRMGSDPKYIDLCDKLCRITHKESLGKPKERMVALKVTDLTHTSSLSIAPVVMTHTSPPSTARAHPVVPYQPTQYCHSPHSTVITHNLWLTVNSDDGGGRCSLFTRRSRLPKPMHCLCCPTLMQK